MPLTKRGSFTDFDDDDLSASDSCSDFTADQEGNKSTRSITSSTEMEDEVLGLTKKDAFAIKASRYIFFLFLMSTAAILGVIVYLASRNDELEEFESQFDNLATEVLGISSENVQKCIGVLGGLSTTMTAFTRFNNKVLNTTSRSDMIDPPGFITLPDVDRQFGAARNTSGAFIIAYMPLVEPGDLGAWNQYSKLNQEWLSESNGNVKTEPIFPMVWDYGKDEHRRYLLDGSNSDCDETHRLLNELDIDDPRVPLSADKGPFAPVWTLSPPPLPNETEIINYNLFEKPVFAKGVNFMEHTRSPVFLDVCDQAKWFGNTDFADELQTVIAHPVFEDFEDLDFHTGGGGGRNSKKIVGHLTAILPWRTFFEDILSEGAENEPITVVMENTCDELFTLEIRGADVTVLSKDEDLHNTEYDHLKITETFAPFANPKGLADAGLGEHCVYSINIYPTQEMEENDLSREPVYYMVVVFCVFLMTSLCFFLFDILVHKRQQQVLNVALKQNAIVESLFPKKIQAQMMAEVDQTNNKLTTVGKAGLKSYLKDTVVGENKTGPKVDKSKPIADLFPETTIMFADIAGFTAWSSTREPSMVFTLLETVYHFFDATAKRRKVFKVEVVGDCYVAVCGLPDPRKDHAVVMARFAHECLHGMDELTKDLEVALGPDTTDLLLRVGLHSGPVVAGVLRGEKSRFQLFGDTMNTASRMESTGIPNRIQVSQETAELLIMAKKTHWLVPRADRVEAKGKGELCTYWLDPSGGAGSGSRSSAGSICGGMSVASGDTGDFISLDDFQLRDAGASTRNRIAEWTVEILACLLKEIEVRRRATAIVDNSEAKRKKTESWEKLGNGKKRNPKHDNVIDEVEEIIVLPDFDAEAARGEKQVGDIHLSREVFEELRNYIQTIASMYNANPFHNFAHANHVTMSVTKLLSRIVAPDVESLEDVNNKSLHDHTYGITSDPLTRFSVVFSALIHDVDHSGVSNMQLVKEKTPESKHYKGKSVAEQNSVDLAWNLLMEPTYENLRKQIYSTEAEFVRFRQLVVNTVMATDIMDKDLKKLRNDRWDKAFSIPPEEERKDPTAVNRKATIVIEHLIQASDVAHTMQHWHIYRKWNERLFREMYKAYEEGRMEKDPSTDWYKGEIGFFDFYIIPLAKKLKDCGVFGVSSDEYLNYAKQNRKEWENRGQEIVAEMVKSAKRKNVADCVFAMQLDSIDREGLEFVKDVLDVSRRRASITVPVKPPKEITALSSLGEVGGGLDDSIGALSVPEFDSLNSDNCDFDIPIKG